MCKITKICQLENACLDKEEDEDLEDRNLMLKRVGYDRNTLR
jgi:hypothetical protein